MTRNDRVMTMDKFTFTSERRDTIAGWSRSVKVGDQEYSVAVRRGKSVRIPYKPRHKNRGWQWHGSVYRIGTNHGHVWSDRVGGSIGCRGLLLAAGVLAEAEVCQHKNAEPHPTLDAVDVCPACGETIQ